MQESYLSETDFSNANLTGANLSKSNVSGAHLVGAQFLSSDLSEADLSNSVQRSTIWSDVDLSTVTGLDTVRHLGPSTLGLDTLYKSGGGISNMFLTGCGVPDDLITYLPSLIEAQNPIQFHSCFISYSHLDEDFVRQLYSQMRSQSLRVWYAPEDLKGGKKLHEQIYEAIQIHDKLLLILSEHSLQSEWVITEIRRARRTEAEEHRRKLFPIRLVDMEALRSWECFDSDSGKDLAIEVREYFIPDFSSWRDSVAFEEMFRKLMSDLKTSDVIR